jgi:two-component system, NarL family, sensor kinase
MYVKTETGIISTNIDVTAAKQSEIAMRKERMVQKQMIFNAALMAQEEERKRIAEGLHNSIGQLLYGIKLSVNKLGIGPVDITDLEKEKHHIEDLLAEAIKETRRISHQLSPTILEDFGLKAALNDICIQFGENIDCRLEFTGIEPNLGKAVDIALYRIVQELMHNIMKHAKASKAYILLDVGKSIVSLQVKDNGIGFNTEDKMKGIGLRGIIDRINLLDGTIRFFSSPGIETKILITIPYCND